ncbi:Type II DNA topoisomerase VI subunit A [Giardia duodenalis]|uniref:DNA topoisomerase (ATP-hydrolyzing) n=1 Tax=Giardia intestinalis TaxID=5741 RepID=V6U2S7_GIAIN|nr:Type II DNA topoisomerase VI subunit A [Giardia intestinalis]
MSDMNTVDEMERQDDRAILDLYRRILLLLYDQAESGASGLIIPMSEQDLQNKKGIGFQKHPLRFARALHMMTESASAVAKKTFINIRSLYYTAPSLYGSQTQSNALITEFCLGYGIEREMMHYRATAKGLLLGNCSVVTQVGTIAVSTLVAVPISPHFFYIQQIHTDAQFTLVIEKDTIFEHLVDNYEAIRDRLGRNFMVITGKGYPDAATRALVSFLDSCRIPILGLADGDAHGMNILCTYAYGSATTTKRSVVPNHYVAPSLVPVGIFSSQIQRSAGSLKGSRHCDATDLKLYNALIARLMALGRSEWAGEVQNLAALGMQYELENILGQEGGLVSYIADVVSRDYRRI